MREQFRIFRDLHRLRAAAFRHDAPDATHVKGLLEFPRLDVRDEVMREEALVLDDAAIHVHEVKRPIRAVAGIHRAEALVGGGEKFAAFGRVRGLHEAIGLAHRESLHQIRRRLRHKGIAAIRDRKRIAAINQRAAGACGSGQSTVSTECFRIVTAIHTRRGMRGVERLIASELRIDAGRVAQQRIARKSLRRQQIGTQHVGVVVEIEPPVVVLAEPPLSATKAHVLLPHAAE